MDALGPIIQKRTKRYSPNTYYDCGEYYVGEIVKRDGSVHYFKLCPEGFEKVKHLSLSLIGGGYVEHGGTKSTRKQLLHRILIEPRADRIVDHINGDRMDNRISNLREITVYQNSWNRKAIKEDGFRGVAKKGKKFCARITTHGRRKYLGTFDTFEEAVEARKQAEKERGEYVRKEKSN